MHSKETSTQILPILYHVTST